MHKLSSSFRLEIILLFFILLLGIFLRYYQLTTVPRGLYIDEASIGYNAATILHTGKDEYGKSFPMAFRAFGEYKMPVYIYLTSGAMIVFGITDFAVRFPSFFLGTLSILVFYFFIKELIFIDASFVPKKGKTLFCLVATFLFAILPWNVMFSRVGFEVNVALFFYLLSCLFFLKTINQKNVLSIAICFFCLAASVYTYDAFRVIAPLTLLSFAIYLYQKFPIKKYIILLFLAALVSMFPIFLFSFTMGGITRFDQTSAFSQYSQLPLLNKFFVYPLVYLQNYLSYFSFPYFFSLGDQFDRQRVLGFGPLLRGELPFLLLGIYYFLKNSKGFIRFSVLFLLFISPVAGALTVPSPHELRSFLLVIPLTIVIGLGATWLFFAKGKLSKILFTVCTIIMLFNAVSFYDVYFIEYPFDSIISWGGGYKDVVTQATKLQNRYKYIVIKNDLGGTNYVYYKFYNPNLHYIEIQKGQIWVKPKNDKNAKVLYIGKYPNDPELKAMPHTFLENIYLPNLNHDIFATFYQL